MAKSLSGKSSLKKSAKKSPAGLKSILPKPKADSKKAAAKATIIHTKQVNKLKTKTLKKDITPKKASSSKLVAQEKKLLSKKHNLKKKIPTKKTVKKIVVPLKKQKPQVAASKPVPAKKRTVSVKKPKVTPFVDFEKLPELYNTTTITLMARDPYWMHAYWEVTPKALAEVQEKMGAPFKKSKFVLRVHDVSAVSNASKAPRSPKSFDIIVDHSASGWYINLWKDNKTYYTDLGIRSAKGVFYPLARSNTVTTPRSTELAHPASPSIPEVSWKKVVEKNGALSFVKAQAPLPQLADQIALPIRPEHQVSQAPLSTAEYFPFEKEMREYYAAYFPSSLNEPAVSKNTQSLVQGLGEHRVAPFHTSEMPPLQLETESDASKDAEIKNDVSLFENVLIGSTKNSPQKPIVPETVQDCISGKGVELLGGASEQLQPQKDFFFELGTELIVYGRTEPKAVVWMGTQKIAMREDGTFSLRFDLPEGGVPLDFTAKPSDASAAKTIVTSVYRAQTRYL